MFQLFFVAFLLVLGEAAHAGEREWQIIAMCFYTGANNYQAMLRCTGMQLPDDIVRSCLSGGSCMDPVPWNQRLDNGAQQLAWQCAQQSQGSVDVFARCAGRNVILPQKQQAILDCAVSSRTTPDFAVCAAPQIGIQLSEEQQIIAGCAMRSEGDALDFTSCAGSALVDRQLTPDQTAVLSCAANALDATDFATCSASRIIGPNLSKEQQIAVQCAAQSQGDSTMFETCAGDKMTNLDLNPEQQIAIQCIVSAGGQPYAATECIATRLTERQLTKCSNDGIGGSQGCFGDNDLVGRNVWTARTLVQIEEGPNSIIPKSDRIQGGNDSFAGNFGKMGGQRFIYG